METPWISRSLAKPSSIASPLRIPLLCEEVALVSLNQTAKTVSNNWSNPTIWSTIRISHTTVNFFEMESM